MKHFHMDRILVRVPNWIGDVVMSLPALVCLAGHTPSGSITLLAKDRVVAVLEALNMGFRIRRYEDGGMSGLWRLKDELKEEGFSIAVLFQNGFEAALLAWLAGIGTRVGYARHFRGALLTHPLRVTEETRRRHQVHYYLEILKALGMEVPARVECYPALSAKADTARVLPPQRPILGLSIGASYGPAKRWKIEGFKEVAERLAKNYGMYPAIFGGTEDTEPARRLSDMLGVEHINLAGKLTLKEFIASLKRVSLFLTNDSGPMHLASAVGTRVVGLFLSTEPALTAPLGTNATYIASPAECRPCFRRTCPRGDYLCVDSLTVEDVYRRCVELLERDEKKDHSGIP